MKKSKPKFVCDRESFGWRPCCPRGGMSLMHTSCSCPPAAPLPRRGKRGVAWLLVVGQRMRGGLHWGKRSIGKLLPLLSGPCTPATASIVLLAFFSLPPHPPTHLPSSSLHRCVPGVVFPSRRRPACRPGQLRRHTLSHARSKGLGTAGISLIDQKLWTRRSYMYAQDTTHHHHEIDV